MDHPTSNLPRIRPADLPLLIVTGLGFPLSQLVIARLGRRGAALVEAVAGVLFARDIWQLSTGAVDRSRPVPAVLLTLEAVAACAAVILGLRSLTRRGVREATAPKPGALEVARRTALGTLFGLQVWRFAVRRGQA
jgi:hypothetical protein